jgi:hypothetical protein
LLSASDRDSSSNAEATRRSASDYAEVQERGAGIDYTIYNAPHGFREFGVQDPDGHDIAFGQRITP